MTARMLVLLVLAGLAAAAPARADRPFAPRFSATTAGAIALAGNTLETCPGSCASVQAGTASAGLDNNDQDMTYVDVDEDPATFDSSSADVDLPPDASVLFAGLYWGGMSASASRDRVLLRAPGASAYEPVTGAVDGSGTSYQGFADVTSLVRSAGTYRVADVQADTGANHDAGWALVVAYREPAAPVRNLSVFDGLTTVASESPASLAISGFLTPPSGTVRSSIGLVGYEGDLGLTGDAATLVSSRGSVGLDEGSQNVFDSSGLGTRDPAYVNQLGFDVDAYDEVDALGNGDTSATLNLTSSGDAYLPGVVTFATEMYVPDVAGDLAVADVTHPDGPVRPGDVLRYTATYTNTGEDAADAFVVRASDGSATLPVGSLPAGGSATVTWDARVPRRAADGSAVTVSALADYTAHTLGTAATAATSAVTSTVRGLADLTTVVTPSSVAPVIGSPVDFTVAVANAGPSAAVDVVAAGTSLGTIPAGGAAVAHVSRVTGTAPLTVSATATSATDDANPADNTGSATVMPVAARVRSPDVRVAVTASRARARVGALIRYRVVITNAGTGDATGVVAAMRFTGARRAVLARPASCSRRLACRVARLAAGGRRVLHISVRAAGAGALRSVTTVSGAPARRTSVRIRR